jgi:tetratricopeptide (TPR) repeat protein
MRRAGLVILSLWLGGCVYYNGMYNANRLARSARKAEREGRTFEANNLWGQVATKAESVVVRHPTSKYAEEAGILRGVALARLGQCEQAMGPLSRVTLAAKSSDLTEDALLATGRCHLTLGNLPAGQAAFSQLLESKNKERRREAHFQRARLLRQAGRYQEALQALEGIREPRADGERILALAGAGKSPEALALADSLIARGDTAKPWDTLLVTLGRQDPVAASQLLDRVGRLPVRSPEIQARRLLDDGIRLVRVDTSRAATRFREAAATAGSSESPGQASLELVRMDLAQTSRPEDLPPVLDSLKGVAKRFPNLLVPADQLSGTINGVHTIATSITQETPQGDLRLFLAGEAARDSLAAPKLANGIFRRILEEWPASPYAPKAIFAAQQLDSTWADSARAILEQRYFDSPYLSVTQGYSPSEYRQLEDSLGAFAASLSAARPARRPGVGPRRTPLPVEEDERPRQRPQPAPGSRVPEP